MNEDNNNIWKELVQKINPEFLRENQELITGIVKAFTDQKSPSTSIDLGDLGMKDPEELYDLLEVVPEYNDLVEENNQLEREYQLMEQELGQLKKENAQLLATVRKAKKMLNSMKSEIEKLRGEKQRLINKLQVHDQFINKFKSSNNNGSD